MENKTDVFIQIGPNGRQPVYATTDSAGCDLYLAADIVVKPGQTVVLPLDFCLALKPGMEAQIRPRSGLSLKTTLRVPNSPGTIDADYRDPVGVIVENTASHFSVLDDLMADPSLLESLKQDYELTSFGEFWIKEKQQDKETQAPIKAEQLAESAALPPALAVLPVYLDRQGNPYGTLYLKKGERIAQMVIARYQQAKFINHDDVASLGKNRGGGFGSTGISELNKA